MPRAPQHAAQDDCQVGQSHQHVCGEGRGYADGEGGHPQPVDVGGRAHAQGHRGDGHPEDVAAQQLEDARGLGAVHLADGNLLAAPLHLVGRVAQEAHQHHQQHDDGGHLHGVAQDADAVVQLVGLALQGCDVDGLPREGVGHVLLQLQQVVAEGFLELEEEVVAAKDLQRVADVGRRLLVEASYLEVLQQAHYLRVPAHGVDGAADDVVAPVHGLREGFVHHHLVIPMLVAVDARHASLEQGHAHERGVVLPALVEAGGEERAASLVGYHRAAVSPQGVASQGDVIHVGQVAEEGLGLRAVLLLEVHLADGDVLCAESHVLAHHVVILRRHHPHHSADKGYSGKLHEEQRPLPALLALGVAAEHLRDGYPCKELPRDDAANHEEQQDRAGRYPQPAACKEIGKASGRRILHKVLEGKEEEHHDQQGQTDDDGRLCQEHAEDACRAGSAALLHAHRLGPPRQRGDGKEGVVQRGDEEDGEAHDQEDDLGALHVVIAPVGVAQRSYLHRVAEVLLVFRRAVLVYHRLQPAVDILCLHALLQAYVLKEGISPAPRIVGLLGRPRRRHGDDGIGLHGGVVRQVGVDASHREVALVVIADDLADGIFAAKHLLGQSPAEVDDIGLLQVLYGIAVQHLDAHRAEEKGVGGNLRLIEAGVAVVQRVGSQPKAGARGRLHLAGEALLDGTRHGAAVHLLPVHLLAFHRELAPDLVEAVVVREARVVTLLESHAGKEQDANRQPQSQGDDLQ